MCNGYEWAFPVNDDNAGLTKREYFSIKILQGLIGHGEVKIKSTEDAKSIVNNAVNIADELIIKLDEI